MPVAHRLPTVGVVITTRNRCPELLDSLEELLPLLRSGEVAQAVVVDNGSTDSTAHAVSALFPEVQVLRQVRDLGPAGRNVGAAALDTDLVAFADDDSWWEPGSLRRAAEVFAGSHELGLLQARLVLEPAGTTHPVCEQLARGPRDADGPGPAVAYHLACAVVLRRDVFLGVGGYHPRLGVGGQERLLAVDLAAQCWAQCYVPEVVAHHHPSARRGVAPRRRARARRGDLVTSLLRMPAGRALRETARLLADVPREPALIAEMPMLLRALPEVVAGRRTAPPWAVRRLDEIERVSRAASPAPTGDLVGGAPQEVPA